VLPENPSVQQLILTSTGKVVDRAEHVRIRPDRLKKFVERAPASLIATPVWDKERHFVGEPRTTAQWIFIMDALNFSFWPNQEQERWLVDWQGIDVKGYWALTCSLKEAMTKGVPLTDAGFLAGIKPSALKSILDGKGVVPMLNERVNVLNEVGSNLQKLYEGSFVNLLEEAKASTDKLIRLVVNNFPCFDDTAAYNKEPVYLLKRAQILCGDLFGAFGGKGLGKFKDLDQLTAFADYKLPQLLRALGILEYSSELAHKVDSFELLPAGCEEELEIRAATVCAVDELRSRLAIKGLDLSVYAIDWWLWDISHDSQYEKHPHHRTRTIFY
jgi:hypothetical protein